MDAKAYVNSVNRIPRLGSVMSCKITMGTIKTGMGMSVGPNVFVIKAIERENQNTPDAFEGDVVQILFNKADNAILQTVISKEVVFSETINVDDSDKGFFSKIKSIFGK